MDQRGDVHTLCGGNDVIRGELYCVIDAAAVVDDVVNVLVVVLCFLRSVNYTKYVDFSPSKRSCRDNCGVLMC